MIIAVKQVLTKICISFLEIFLSSRSGGRPVDSVRMLSGRLSKIGAYTEVRREFWYLGDEISSKYRYLGRLSLGKWGLLS